MKKRLLLWGVPAGILSALVISSYLPAPPVPPADGPGSGAAPFAGTSGPAPRVPSEPAGPPEGLAALAGFRDDAVSMAPVRAWYRHGRKPPLRAQALAGIPAGLLRGFARGETLRLAMPDHRELTAVVRTVAEPEPGLQVLGGKIVSPRDGYFHFEQKEGVLHGRMGFKGDDTVALIFPVSDGVHAFVEQKRELTMCQGAQRDLTDIISGVFAAGVILAIPNFDPYNLQSLPGAAGVIFIDFDGHTVANTAWNSEYTDGDDIVAEPFDEFVVGHANYRPEWIFEVFNRCKEDFAPFNLNVTTKQSVFDAASAGRRQRVIITSTASWYPDDAGGVAYAPTFTYNSDTPCWVWNGGIQWSMPETVSHEAGHTLGLSHSSHDTSNTPFDEYYDGHGIWAPIMGNSFKEQKPYTLWDNGFYNGATNTEDQVAIIADTGAGTNNVGFRADDRGDTQGTATVVNANAGGVIHTSGRIGQNGDKDVYRFTMPAGTFDILGESHDPGPNAYLKLTLRNNSYNIIKSTTTAGSQPAHTTYTSGSGATYYLEVTNTQRAEGNGDQGFPAYGAIGSYRLEITEPGGDDERPVPFSMTGGPAVFGYDSLEVQVVVTDNKAVRMDTLFTGDLTVTKGASTWTPSILSTASDPAEGSKKVTAKFRFNPPGGFWDTSDAGTYTFTFKSYAVGDTNGNLNNASLVKTLTVPATDATPPKVDPPDPWPATVMDAAQYEFTLEFWDLDTAFNTGSFGAGDIEVKDPDGNALPVQFVGMSASNYNRSVFATYRVTPPGGTWDEDEVGEYAVKVLAGQVLLSTGASMSATTVGAFPHRAVLFERNMDADPGFTLNAGWAWGTPTGGGGTGSGNGPDPDSAHTGTKVLGTNLNGNYASNTPVRTATSPIFSTVGFQNLTLNYWKWLNVDDPVAVDYRVGAGAWKSLLSEDFEYMDEWEEVTLGLPPECDNHAQVQLRWSIGPTGPPAVLRPMGGWNIDDIRVLASERFAPGRVLMSWFPAGRFSLDEGGSSRSYILRLDQDPGPTPVTVNLSSLRGTGDLTHPLSVIIDSTNWSTGKAVSISSPDNSWVEGSRSVTLRHSVSSTNSHFSGLVGPSLVVTIFDDDEPIIRDQPGDLTLPQGTQTSLNITTWPVSGILSYQWYSGETGETSRPINGATSAILNVTVGGSASRYWVRATRFINIFVSYVEYSDSALVAPLTGYAAWKHDLLGHGYTQGQLDAAAFDAGDPEFDTVAHLMEYALGGQPYTPDSPLLPRMIMLADGPHFRFRRARSDVDYVVQVSDDLQSWADFLTNPGIVDAAADQDVPLPGQSALARYARLRVSR